MSGCANGLDYYHTAAVTAVRSFKILDQGLDVKEYGRLQAFPINIRLGRK